MAAVAPTRKRKRAEPEYFKRVMTAHFLEDGKYRKKIVQAKQTCRTKLLPGFELPLARLFELADQWSAQEENA